MENVNNSLNIGLVLLSPDFRVVGINDYARRLYGPVLKELGNSIMLCHSRKSRERVSGLLKELTKTHSDMPRTMVIDVLGKVVMFNLSQLSIISPTPQAYWSVSFMDISKQAGASKNPEDGIVEMKRIPVYDGGTYRFLAAGEVLCIQSDGDYCKVFTDGKSYYLHMSLKSILQRYTKAGLFRAHKSFVVNLQRISKISRTGRGQTWIIFDDTSLPSIPVSRRLAAPLKKAMAIKHTV